MHDVDADVTTATGTFSHSIGDGLSIPKRSLSRCCCNAENPIHCREAEKKNQLCNLSFMMPSGFCTQCFTSLFNGDESINVCSFCSSSPSLHLGRNSVRFSISAENLLSIESLKANRRSQLCVSEIA